MKYMICKILPPLIGGGPISKNHTAFERRKDSMREALTHGVWIFFFFERMAWYLDFGGLKYPPKSLNFIVCLNRKESRGK